MSKKRNKRNTKKVLKSLQAKRAAYHSGGHTNTGSFSGWQPHNPNSSSHSSSTGGGGSFGFFASMM